MGRSNNVSSVLPLLLMMKFALFLVWKVLLVAVVDTPRFLGG